MKYHMASCTVQASLLAVNIFQILLNFPYLSIDGEPDIRTRVLYLVLPYSHQITHNSTDIYLFSHYCIYRSKQRGCCMCAPN